MEQQHRLHSLSYPTPIAYHLVRTWQQAWVANRCYNPHLDDLLLLIEHPSVYTLGRGADPQFLKPEAYRTGWDIHRIERGGEVTYHCPGQLVGYPILNLQRYQPDLHWYLRQLEQVSIQVLAKFGLQGDRIPGLTGVWIGDRKVTAIGIKVSRWITMHGFSLNVCPDLTGFEYIVPCGISDKSIGSLAQFIPGITVEMVRPVVAQTFAEVFDALIVDS